MSEFEQLYWQFLEVVAMAQDRCAAAVAAMIRYDDSGHDVPDEVLEEDQRARFQSIAPNVEAGLYRVPKVIE